MTAYAEVVLAFGRGVTYADGHYALSAASLARVRAAVEHVRSGPPGRRPRVIFTGGWAEASEGAAEPPAGSAEGDLMLAYARTAGLGEHADLRSETRSRSTLENLVHTVRDGLLDGYDFHAGRPLGLVTHAWHLPRVRYLAGKVLGLPPAALLDVPVTGDDLPGRERLTLAVARIGFLGVRDPAALLRRERWLVSVLRGR